MTSFQSRRVSRSHSITINDVPARVFLLFTPEEEKKWDPGWDYTLLFPHDGNIEENVMFLTTGHDHADEQAIWIISNYKPSSYCIDYLRIEPGEKIGKIEIVCENAGDGKSFAQITYTYTSLSDDGNKFLESFTEEFYVDYISRWENAINYYLKTGKMISD